MTTKLNFLKAACITFNCTPSVVLGAVTERFSVHPETARQIKQLADKSCNATTDEWKALAAQLNESPIAEKILWSLVSGAEI